MEQQGSNSGWPSPAAAQSPYLPHGAVVVEPDMPFSGVMWSRQGSVSHAAPAGSAVAASILHDGTVIDAREVRSAIGARRRRDKFFGAGLFEEPGWDMMLELFGAELEGTRVTVSSLCIAASVAPTTALRWIKNLVDAGLFEREPDQFDRRRAFIALSERASQMMRNYIVDLRRAGLSLA